MLFQEIERLAHGVARDAEFAGQVTLRRQPRAGGIFLRANARQQAFRHDANRLGHLFVGEESGIRRRVHNSMSP